MENKNTPKKNIQKNFKFRGGNQHVIKNMYLEMQLIKHVNNEEPRVLETSENK
jgi:hypothetical protein